MSVPYTYKVTHIPSGKNYYGARWAKDCHPDDLWVTYFTSSKIIKTLIDSDGVDSFCTEIRKIFKDQKSCVRWEQKVLVRLGVPRNKNWLNLNCASSLTSEEWKASLMANHGVDHPSKIPGWSEQFKKTSMDRFGVEYPQRSPIVQSKIQKTMLERYGYLNSSKNPEIRGRISESLYKFFENSEELTCPKCGYSCKAAGVMKRWHMDNCIYYKIIPLHESGKSPLEIQHIIGLHAHSVSKFIVSKGMKPNKPKMLKLSQNASNCINVRHNGVTYRSINSLAKELGVRTSRIYKMIELGEVEVVKYRESE